MKRRRKRPPIRAEVVQEVSQPEPTVAKTPAIVAKTTVTVPKTPVTVPKTPVVVVMSPATKPVPPPLHAMRSDQSSSGDDVDDATPTNQSFAPSILLSEIDDRNLLTITDICEPETSSEENIETVIQIGNAHFGIQMRIGEVNSLPSNDSCSLSVPTESYSEDQSSDETSEIESSFLFPNLIAPQIDSESTNLAVHETNGNSVSESYTERKLSLELKKTISEYQNFDRRRLSLDVNMINRPTNFKGTCSLVAIDSSDPYVNGNIPLSPGSDEKNSEQFSRSTSSDTSYNGNFHVRDLHTSESSDIHDLSGISESNIMVPITNIAIDPTSGDDADDETISDLRGPSYRHKYITQTSTESSEDGGFANFKRSSLRSSKSRKKIMAHVSMQSSEEGNDGDESDQETTPTNDDEETLCFFKRPYPQLAPKISALERTGSEIRRFGYRPPQRTQSVIKRAGCSSESEISKQHPALSRQRTQSLYISASRSTLSSSPSFAPSSTLSSSSIIERQKVADESKSSSRSPQIMRRASEFAQSIFRGGGERRPHSVHVTRGDTVEVDGGGDDDGEGSEVDGFRLPLTMKRSMSLLPTSELLLKVKLRNKLASYTVYCIRIMFCPNVKKYIWR